MKKALVLFLSFVLIFSFCACRGEKKKAENSVDVEYYAKLGQMPESEFKIGDDVEQMKTELNKRFEEQEDAVYNFVEGSETALIDIGHLNYYYYKDKVDDGISYIISYDKGFGFESGTVSLEVIDVLSDFEYKREKINDQNAFFVLAANDGEVLKYTFSKYTVTFIFIDNALYATTIYKTSDWE